MMEKSIYQQICDKITDGILDSDFALYEQDSDASEIKWAPGALDGVYIYHMPHADLDAAQAKRMARALKCAAGGDFPKADAMFFEWTKDVRAVSCIDELQKYVIGHERSLDAGNVFHTALFLVLYSTHIECVKIGLELLELFGDPQEKLKEIIRRIGLYDEFTIFAVWNMLKWEKGNDEIFALAKKVHSWGRIHAVERLSPDTDEIRHWILTEGTINTVENAYSSLTCWQKSGAEELLSGKPTPEEYAAITTLIDGLIDEGPVPGISEIENAESVLLRFLELSSDYTLGTDEYDVILSIRQWADDENLPSVSSACDQILHSKCCTEAVLTAVKEGQALRLADELGLPFRRELLECMRKDFDKNFNNCGYLMKNRDYIEPTLQLFREKLPLSEMAGEPEDNIGLGEEYKSYDQLQFILQELAPYPLTGMDFMTAGLQSPLTRNRNRALTNLKNWVQEKQLPLASLSPELYKLVEDLRDKEVNDDAMVLILPLLDGQTVFTDENEDDVDESEDE